MQSEIDDDGDDDVEYDHVPAQLPEPEPIDTTGIRRVWIGLLIIAIVFFPVYSPFRLLYAPVVRWLQPRTFYEEVAFDILYQWLRTACVLLVIWWDGAPLGVFGIKKPKWSMDIVTTVIAFAARWKLVEIAAGLFAGFLLSLNYKLPVHHRIFQFDMPEGSCAGVIMLFVLSLSIGLSEELVVRGYLIPRLERALQSTFWAVLISSVFFGCWHLPRSIIAAWSAFWAGVIYGIVFVSTRRLWPTVVAHGMYDFVLFLWAA